MIGQPYLALAAAGAIAVAGVGGFFFGQDYHAGKVAKRELKSLTTMIAERDAKQARIDVLTGQVAKREQNRQEDVRYVYQQVPKIIRDPVYRNVCISDDGVRLLGEATAIANGQGRGAPAGGTGGAADARGDGRSGDGKGDR